MRTLEEQRAESADNPQKPLTTTTTPEKSGVGSARSATEDSDSSGILWRPSKPQQPISAAQDLERLLAKLVPFLLQQPEYARLFLAGRAERRRASEALAHRIYTIPKDPTPRSVLVDDGKPGYPPRVIQVSRKDRRKAGIK